MSTTYSNHRELGEFESMASPYMTIDPADALRRLNRRLERERVYKARGEAQIKEAGEYFLVRGDKVIQRFVDIESLGRAKGALREFEVIGA
jgi:hypothetical protein